MRKKFRIIMIGILISIVMACSPKGDKPITIGIIEPLEHVAMDDIVEGFRTAIQEQSDKSIIIKVENAQNDLNLQRAIIQKMKSAHYDIIVPIGTSVSQMAVSMAPKQTIVSLASDISDVDRSQLNTCKLSVVHDEISAETILIFVKKIYPNLKNIMLIHSATEKVIPEVNEAIRAGHSLDITVHHRLVTTLSELNTVSRSLSSKYDGVFILKDNLIASGAATLSQIAKQKEMIFIASDEGSVKEGADIALGVKERQIGVEGGRLVAAILDGKTPCELPIVEMTNLVVFINPAHNKIKSQLPHIQKLTKDSRYSLEIIDNDQLNGG